jgi:glutamate-5-semialdehyde dehydrogenase
MTDIRELAKQSRQASISLGVLSDEKKKQALETVSSALINRKEEVFAANRADLERAQAEQLAAPLLGRLTFDEHKLQEVLDGIRQLIQLPDPIGTTLLSTELAPGLELYRVSCPIGVIGVIFESRPDALVQISALCLKSGNAVLLKGGSEARETNRALTEIIREASLAAGCPNGWISLMESHADVDGLLTCDQDVDLLIPRGSNEFVQYIMSHTRIPVLGHADGVCHTYVDVQADPEMAIRVLVDAKTQYVSVCNATEMILLHKDLPEEWVLRMVKALQDRNVTIYGDERMIKLISCRPISEMHHEYLDYAVSVHFVEDVRAAVDHINEYGSGHTDAILTSDGEAAEYFMARCDSGNVFWNCSTRFSDGFRYGFGAEVGVSTSKIHARGPVGLEGLVTYKYKLFGNGDVVGEFSNNERRFTHRNLLRQSPF